MKKWSNTKALEVLGWLIIFMLMAIAAIFMLVVNPFELPL